MVLTPWDWMGIAILEFRQENLWRDTLRVHCRKEDEMQPMRLTTDKCPRENRKRRNRPVPRDSRSKSFFISRLICGLLHNIASRSPGRLMFFKQPMFIYHFVYFKVTEPERKDILLDVQLENKRQPLTDGTRASRVYFIFFYLFNSEAHWLKFSQVTIDKSE